MLSEEEIDVALRYIWSTQKLEGNAPTEEELATARKILTGEITVEQAIEEAKKKK